MTISSRLPGVALITGAGGTGIGAAVARAFAVNGCTRFAITDLNATSLSSTHDAVRALNPSAEILSTSGDVSDESFVARFVKDAIGTFGRVDYSVQCAGILGKGLRSHEATVDEFDQINRVNYRGTWLVSRAVLGHMIAQAPLDAHSKQRGAIVHVASQLGVVARPAAAAYCASKSAIINMTRADAIDYSRDQIRVNCVCPGVIATPMTTGSQEVEDRLRSAIDIAPMGRMGTPEEIADTVVFLSSKEAAFVQGHALVVDGGYTIN
ncbi:short-chain dehydrogenase [Emericellopsis cladophorae]|uniref:Short-chain dehydrogenase n=1 Tax=Emericellopsis cladophorae TaxID=2686198 RepID=A0A9P9XX62_9HYPO|nr:short-chain dehydrogenase [Emericellopsis cladophorae]KAI6779350.1 short-chain dehydrogenase [Emericellopsis cladophorae]